jgi:hypothetical protein
MLAAEGRAAGRGWVNKRVLKPETNTVRKTIVRCYLKLGFVFIVLP